MRIGLFDSGVGGLTVMAACKRLLPRASYVYMDDASDAPYGEKSDEEIISAADRCVSALLGAGCGIIVIACNTATAVAAPFLRAKYADVPILGLEPAVAPALAAERGKVLLLATPATVRHKSYPPRVIVGAECTLASDVERAYGCPSALHALARRTLAKYRGYSAVVTGCSHYAHLSPYIHCRVYDGADGVARRLLAIISGKAAPL